MKSKARTAVHISIYSLICLVVVGSAFVLGYVSHSAHAPAAVDVPSFSVFWESWRLVDDYFYGDASDETTRTRGAIRGSLEVLGDPYTIFIEPQQRDREQEELRGSFGGIGAFVERKADGRIILTPMDGSPALKAGVMTGDELIAVDDVEITPEMPFADILDMVRGQVNKPVKLTIRREGQREPLTFEVNREEIVTPAVSWRLEDADIGYIQLSMFNERTNDELEEAVLALREQGAQRYIIDLRNNGGGLLTSAIDVASQFLKDGVVMYERTSTGEEKPYPVKAHGTVEEEPVVFLINGGTASASEIVAGAIQDYGRGKLVGTRSFGKASVQLIFDLGDGSSLHVTNAHWLTPNLKEIHSVGLVPDIEVEFTEEDRENDRDPQLEEAIAYLKTERASQESAP